jgi:hypothetical protein
MWLLLVVVNSAFRVLSIVESTRIIDWDVPPNRRTLDRGYQPRAAPTLTCHRLPRWLYDLRPLGCGNFLEANCDTSINTNWSFRARNEGFYQTWVGCRRPIRQTIVYGPSIFASKFEYSVSATLAGLTTYFSNYTNVVALRLIHSCIHLELGRFSPQGLSYRSRTFENSRLIPLPVAFSTSTCYFSSYFHVHRGGFQWVFSSCRCRSWWRFTNHGGGFQAEQTVMVQEGQPWLDHVILVRYFI